MLTAHEGYDESTREKRGRFSRALDIRDATAFVSVE